MLLHQAINALKGLLTAQGFHALFDRLGVKARHGLPALFSKVLSGFPNVVRDVDRYAHCTFVTIQTMNNCA